MWCIGSQMCSIGFGDDDMHINGGWGLMLKFGNANFSTTVCPFGFIFGIIRFLASVHMIML